MLKNRIHGALQRNSMTTSQLAMALGTDMVNIMHALAEMEWRGQVVRIPDGTWSVAGHRTVVSYGISYRQLQNRR